MEPLLHLKPLSSSFALLSCHSFCWFSKCYVTMEPDLHAEKKRVSFVCRLCASPSVTLFYTDRTREYFQCNRCSLVFVPDRFLLSSADEKALYDLHQNIPGDARYEKFLSRAAEPLAEYVSSMQNSGKPLIQTKGLDFGCGPAPVLANMLSSPPYNYSMDVYDLYYFPETRHCLTRESYYDFIVATEVVEHLQDPMSVLQTLWRCIRPDGGVLVIMTKRVHGTIERFRGWHYIRDPSHITFFHNASFQWIANSLPSSGDTCEARFVGTDVVLLVKQIRAS